MNHLKNRYISTTHQFTDIKNILAYQNTSDSCIFYLTFNSNKLIGPFIFNPKLNPEQNQYRDMFLQTGKINAFNPKDLLYMRNHREIPMNKVQITDQILDAAYDLERFILDENRKPQYSIHRSPYVDQNLTQIINDLIGNTQFTITATPVAQNELFVKNANKGYKQQITNLYRVLDELHEQISELKEENNSLRAQLDEYKLWANKCEFVLTSFIGIQDERVNESTFAWYAKLNALLDQYRAENDALKSHNYTLKQSQQALYQDQEYIQQENNKLKQEVEELKRSQNLILARSQSVLREERERMNREQEELSREIANVKRCQRSHIPIPNNENYSVPDCPKHRIFNKQDGERSKEPEIETNKLIKGMAYARQNANKQALNQTTKLPK
ncbi:Tafazzin [Schistosoma japonicum]|nr:Tafazzin [Schistosoma japonicum]